MKGFIYGNQTYFYILCVIVFLVILYFIFKSLPTKIKKKETKEQEKKADISQNKEIKEPEKFEKVEELEVSGNIEKTQEESKKDKKQDKKPKIVQIYKREHRDESGEIKQKTIDPIYDRNVEFINTSKNIAKFKSFAEDKGNEESLENVDDFGFVQDIQEDCNFCENKVKHFDHTRRLSRAIKEDNFDNLFESHISEKYMNINSKKHLDIEKEYNEMFKRTQKMLLNSDGKLKTDSDSPEIKNSSLFFDVANNGDDDLIDDDVKINMKTALIAETYFGKRKKK